MLRSYNLCLDSFYYQQVFTITTKTMLYVHSECVTFEVNVLPLTLLE